MFLIKLELLGDFPSTLTKFDLRLTLTGTINPTFDLTVRTSWD